MLYGLAEHSGTRALYITQQPACSSNFLLASGLYNHRSPLAEMKPVRALDVDFHFLDKIAAVKKLDAIAAVKLDTQGSELEKLRGGKKILRNCCLINIEIAFSPLYGGAG